LSKLFRADENDELSAFYELSILETNSSIKLDKVTNDNLFLTEEPKASIALNREKSLS
jgi:hypothetical protein